MDSRSLGGGQFTLGLALRAAAIGLLAFGALQLGLRQHLYATALLLILLAGAIGLELRRALGAADREMARFVDGIIANSFDRVGSESRGFAALAGAINRASSKLQANQVARQQHSEFLQTLADSVTATLLVVKQDGTIVLANRAAQRLAGEHVRRLADIEALGPETAALLTALAPGARQIVRLRDGRQALASAVLFRVPGARPQRLISLQDVAVELGAVELKAWQDLVRILSHEMMNSLTPVASLAESVRGILTSVAEGREDAATAFKEVDAAAEIIARRSLRLMAFVDRYRKVAEVPQPVLQPVPVEAFVNDLDRLMRPPLIAAGASYASEVEPGLLVAQFDPAMIEQALINLVLNAAEAVEGRPDPMVRVECARRGDQLEFRVRDNGPGVDDAFRDQLFVPFFTTKAAGSGIGLSVARQIALAHQGQLQASRAESGGAVFTLTLPAHSPAALEAEA